MQKRVVAKEMGVYGGSRRRAGEVFDVGKDANASWYEPLPSEKPEANPKPKAKAK